MKKSRISLNFGGIKLLIECLEKENNNILNSLKELYEEQEQKGNDFYLDTEISCCEIKNKNINDMIEILENARDRLLK